MSQVNQFKATILNPGTDGATHTGQNRAMRLVKTKRAQAVKIRMVEGKTIYLAIKLISVVSTAQMEAQRDAAQKKRLQDLQEFRSYDAAAHSGILRQYQAHSIFAGQIERLALPA